MDNIITNDLAVHMLYEMMLIREFENTVGEYKLKRQIYGMAHCCNGQEAIAVGTCTALKDTDYVISNHRPHGHAIAKGVDITKMFAEIFGKSTGTNGGKGGSMHIVDKNVNFLPSTGIVASGIPVACGTAFASKMQKNHRISCVFFGDGAANEGVLAECLNIASIWSLPIMFVLEDNGLAVTTQTKDTSACREYVQLANAYNIKAMKIDGQDVELVYRTAEQAAEYIRSEEKPVLIHATTVRFSEHAEGEYYRKMRETKYRDYDKLDEQMRKECPIINYTKVLSDRNVMTEKQILDMKQKVKEKIEDSLRAALDSPLPNEFEAFENRY